MLYSFVYPSAYKLEISSLHEKNEFKISERGRGGEREGRRERGREEKREREERERERERGPVISSSIAPS